MSTAESLLLVILAVLVVVGLATLSGICSFLNRLDTKLNRRRTPTSTGCL